MPTKAYVLIETTVGRSREIADKLYEIDGVETVDQVTGPYDLIVVVKRLDLNSVGNLTAVNEAIKQNLKTYMGQYRMLTDAVNIKDGYIINIGVNFEIIVLSGYIKREVLLSCVGKVKDIFSLDKWQFNQPIALSDIYTELAIIEGVQSVISVDVENKWDADLGYSGNVYDIEEATKNDIIYPSMDPSVFEIKYLDSDIKGRVAAT